MRSSNFLEDLNIRGHLQHSAHEMKKILLSLNVVTWIQYNQMHPALMANLFFKRIRIKDDKVESIHG